MRGTFVYRDGALVPKHLAPPLARGPSSDLPCPHLIRDGIDPLLGMHDGKLYDSKSALRASYKAAGVVELGNDAPTAPRQPERPTVETSEIAAAYEAVSQGYKPQIDFEQIPNQTGWSDYNAS